MKTVIKRSDSTNPDFIFLVEKLNAYLAVQNGEKHDFFNQFNHIDNLRNVVVLYVDDKPVACGAFKELEPGRVEIKRMYVLEDERRKGFSKQVLGALHAWAKELGYTQAVLETAKRFQDAVGLYANAGYSIIPNYGQYAGVEESVCMRIALD